MLHLGSGKLQGLQTLWHHFNHSILKIIVTRCIIYCTMFLTLILKYTQRQGSFSTWLCFSVHVHNQRGFLMNKGVLWHFGKPVKCDIAVNSPLHLYTVGGLIARGKYLWWQKKKSLAVLWNEKAQEKSILTRGHVIVVIVIMTVEVIKCKVVRWKDDFCAGSYCNWGRKNASQWILGADRVLLEKWRIWKDTKCDACVLYLDLLFFCLFMPVCHMWNRYMGFYWRVYKDDGSIRAQQFGKTTATAQHARLLAAVLFVPMMSVMLRYFLSMHCWV